MLNVTTIAHQNHNENSHFVINIPCERIDLVELDILNIRIKTDGVASKSSCVSLWEVHNARKNEENEMKAIRPGYVVAFSACLALMGSIAASPARAESLNDGSATSPGSSARCIDVAKLALESAQVEVASKEASFACFGDEVVVTLNAGSPFGQRIYREVVYADESMADRDSAAKQSEDVLFVPFDSAKAVCNGQWNRQIQSELEELLWGCVGYGQYNLQTGAAIWERKIDWEWTMYPGRPSAQNKLRTIPLTGSPTMAGTFTSQRMNGILPPIQLATSIFKNVGNTTTTGWVVGDMTVDASHNVKLADVTIKDSAMGFNEYFGGAINTHRFKCQALGNRCFFPNGQEAGL